ncbi:hypothetical protein [Halorarum halobium]|uniref:hypothetical protein n=1 Tax=Halorarum halobium TaxID=3075121 RepID=UPI0028AC315F|nr:hypothetical protein [Halobaculum sp. XH14]
MPIEPKGDQSKVKVAAVDVKDLRVENRGGSEIVVLEAADGAEYSNFKNKLEAEFENRDKYLGSYWLIQFTTREKGGKTYKNLIGFEEELDAVHGHDTSRDSDRDDSIIRQSAAHDASRLVEGMLAGGYFMKTRGGREDIEDEIQEELEKWTERFKTHHRTGEWG